MNFKIFDDDFDVNKKQYYDEILQMQKSVIDKDKQKEFINFVDKVLVDTRSYYILIFALKVMKNLNKINPATANKQIYDYCLVNALSFMPDKTFIETGIMIVAKFHKLGNAFAQCQEVDVELLINKAKELAKKESQKK